MNKSLLLVSSMSLVLLTACTSKVERQTASGSYKYIEAKQRTTLNVPDSVDRPEFSDRYELPELPDTESKPLIGRDLVIQSPSLVIPLVSGSHIEETDKQVLIWFDQINDSESLSKTIWDSVIGYLEQENIDVAEFNPEQGYLKTGWIENITQIKKDDAWYKDTWLDDISLGEWLGLSEPESVERAKFTFTMTVKPHGRSASLQPTLDAFERDGELVAVDDMLERRQEAAVLNHIVEHYEYENQRDSNRRLAQIRQGIDMEMGFDADGHPAFVMDAQYDIAWPRIQLVLRKLGFNVKDLDKSNGLIFVQYTDSEVSWWEEWFAKKGNQLLDYDDYRLNVTRLGDKTAITFMSDESVPFEANAMTELFKPFVQVMSEDNLDI
jgi:outer membrane protein assembly factor BamC